MGKGKATIMKYATKGGGSKGEQNKIAATVGTPDNKSTSGGNTGDACMGMGKGCGCKGVCGCKF